jgi:hypothetical protein
VTIDATDTELIVHFADGGARVVARTNDHPVRWIKAHRPRKVELSHTSTLERVMQIAGAVGGQDRDRVGVAAHAHHVDLAYAEPTTGNP